MTLSDINEAIVYLRANNNNKHIQSALNALYYMRESCNEDDNGNNTIVPCFMPDGIIIKPDGIHEAEAHVYDSDVCYSNISLCIWKCKKCGHYSLQWRKQPDTNTISENEYFNQ